MPNITITQLPAAGPIQGNELIPIVQNGQTLRTTASAISSAPNQQQTFLTINQEPTLPNSRYLSTGTGIGLADGGAQSFYRITLNGASGSLEAAGNGMIAKTASNAVTNRSITASGAGISVSNGSGVAGDPTVSLTGLALALANTGGTGMLAVVGGTVIAGRQIYGTASQIDVANGNGSDSPVISIASNPVIPGTEAMTIPKGTTAQQPAGSDGQIRFNLDTQLYEGYASGTWNPFSLSGGVTTFSAGSTGLTPVLATSGAVTLGGTLNVSSGGTGASTLTGYLVGNGTSAFTAVATIPNAGLTNSSVTYNGVTVALGSSGTITAFNPNALTIGTGLSGGSYDGSTAVTIAIDSTVATLTGTQTLTNKTISGASNTLSNIDNTSLTNSSITINGSSVALGGSVTVTATASNALTIGTGLSGVSYNGSAAVTIAIDSTVATLTGNQTLTNKSISGATNTLSNIPNSSLSNYTISGVALGSNLFGLTIGTGLSGSSYDGSGAVTIAIDSTVATLTGTQTLTNKSISGSTNTLTNIPNTALTNSSVTIGSTNVALGGTTTTLAGLTSITLTQDPVSDLQVATKQYVDSIASGLNYHQPVNYASTAALPAYTYNNGTGGVGATITANANGALSFGGGSPTAGQRLLVKDEAGANQPYNGIYTVTSAGSAGSPFQLTRATDYDTSGVGTNEIDAGDYVLVLSGTNASTAWVQQTPLPIVVGTTAIVFLQFNAPVTYTAGTGLNLSPATQFNISNTGITAAAYGSASSVATFTVNAQGQLTLASSTPIAINGNQITSGTVGSAYITGSYTGITGVGTLTAGTWNATAVDPAYGGTGLSSYAVGDITYATGTTTLSKLPIGTSGQILTSTGTAPRWSTLSGVAVTTFSGGTTGLTPSSATSGAITLGGTLAVANGGTNSTATPTAGAVAYGTGTAYAFTSAGSVGQVLASSGTSAPTWLSFTSSNTSQTLVSRDISGNFSAGTISANLSGTATNATNTAITANSTSATNYLTFVSATTGNLPQLVNSNLTVNPSTGQITNGVAGGSF